MPALMVLSVSIVKLDFLETVLIGRDLRDYLSSAWDDKNFE